MLKNTGCPEGIGSSSFCARIRFVKRALAPLALFVACVLAQSACNNSGSASSSGNPGQPPGSGGGGSLDPSVCPAADTLPPLPGPLTTTTAIAGTVEGSFSVTSAGDAEYTIPLV